MPEVSSDYTWTYAEFGTIRIIWYWHKDLDIVGGTPPLELPPDLDHVLHPRPSMALNARFDPDQRFDGLRKAVRHKFKLAVWWNEGDGAVVFEAG